MRRSNYLDAFWWILTLNNVFFRVFVANLSQPERCLIGSRCISGTAVHLTNRTFGKANETTLIPGEIQAILCATHLYCPLGVKSNILHYGETESNPVPLPIGFLQAAVLCPAGFLCPSPANVLLCDVGMFCSGLGNAFSETCPRGSYSNSTGLSRCHPCKNDIVDETVSHAFLPSFLSRKMERAGYCKLDLDPLVFCGKGVGI